MFKIFSRNRPRKEFHSELYGPVHDAMQDVQAYAQSHGGKIELLSVSDEGVVIIRFRGACAGCPMSDLTLKMGIEERLRALVPQVTKVVVH